MPFVQNIIQHAVIHLDGKADHAKRRKRPRVFSDASLSVFPMPVPEATSAEGLERYVGGKCLVAGRVEAWRDIKAWIVALPPIVDTLHLPSVSEPFLAWTISGEIDFQERENKQSWITHRIKKGSFFLAFWGAPYECRWIRAKSRQVEQDRVRQPGPYGVNSCRPLTQGKEFGNAEAQTWKQ